MTVPYLLVVYFGPTALALLVLLTFYAASSWILVRLLTARHAALSLPAAGTAAGE